MMSTAKKRRANNGLPVPAYPCIACGREVRPRQQALQCSDCDRWQHRTCGTGITQEIYRTAVKEKKEIDWSCTDCSNIQPPLHQSPAHSPESATATPDFAPLVTPPPGFAPLITPPPGFGTFITPPPGFASPTYSSPVITPPPIPQDFASPVLQLATPTNPPPLFSISPDINDLPDRQLNSFQEPTVLEESNLEQTLPTPATEDTTEDTSQQEPDFTIVVGGSSRGADVLVEKSNYLFNKDGKPSKTGIQRWRCVVRNKHTTCSASVLQDGTSFRNSILKQNTTTKQVPPSFALMSRRSKDDYIAILEYLRTKTTNQLSLNCVVMDFEVAVWGAFRSVFPTCTIRGCSFHWGQCIWRKIQDYGLAPAYRTKQTTNKYLRQLLCLPFLPAEHIQPIFKDIRDLLQPSPPEGLHKLLQYIDDNWKGKASQT